MKADDRTQVILEKVSTRPYLHIVAAYANPVSKIIMETTKKQIELQQWQKFAIFLASSAAGFWLGLHTPTALPYAPHHPLWDVLKESILFLLLFAFVPFAIAMVCKTWRWFLVGTCTGSLLTFLAGLGLRYLFTK